MKKLSTVFQIKFNFQDKLNRNHVLTSKQKQHHFQLKSEKLFFLSSKKKHLRKGKANIVTRYVASCECVNGVNDNQKYSFSSHSIHLLSRMSLSNKAM